MTIEHSGNMASRDAQLLEAVRRLAAGDLNVEISGEAAKSELGRAIASLAESLRRSSEEARALSRGEVSGRITGEGELPDALRDVQANLRHMVWQARMAAKGDLTQRVEAMGDISEAFNEMLHRMRESREALIQKNRELDAANRRLAELNQLKDEFLSMVTHDLRSPLTSIIGYAEFVLGRRRSELPEDVVRALDTIYRAGHRQLDLINDLLDLRRIEAGRIHLDPQPGFLSEVLSESRDLMMGYAGERGTSIDMVLPSPEPVVIFDRARILQVVNNLVSNAIKFSDPGSEVTLGMEQLSPAEVAVYVRDRGQGVAPEDLPLLFQKFSQARSKPKNGVKGSGLGLSISKSIVELHGGRMLVESALGEGSTFTFTLPLASDGARSEE